MHSDLSFSTKKKPSPVEEEDGEEVGEENYTYQLYIPTASIPQLLSSNAPKEKAIVLSVVMFWEGVLWHNCKGHVAAGTSLGPY